MPEPRNRRRLEPDPAPGNQEDESADLDGRSMDELRRLAKELELTDYDALDRDALVEAIQHGRGDERAQKGGMPDSEYGTGYTGDDGETGSARRGR